MSKKNALWLASLALLISACAGQVGQALPSNQAPVKVDIASTVEHSLVLAGTAAVPATSAPAPAGCRTYARGSPTPTVPGAADDYLLPGDWMVGPEHPTLTIIWYGDFQCRACAQLAQALALLSREFPADLRVVYRFYPQVSASSTAAPAAGTPPALLDKSALAEQAVMAAGKQGKFWSMQDLLYADQEAWLALDAPAFQDWLAARAADLKLDTARFAADLVSPEAVQKAAKDWQEGQAIGLPPPPALFVNGKLADYSLSYWNLSAVIRLTLLGEHQFATCPDMLINPAKRYVATLKTEKGDIVLDLFADRAPLAVNNFVFLTRQGWYTNLTFHRVLPGFVAQSGDPSGTGFGGPGYAFDNEIVPSLTFDRPGLLAMANAGPNSNGSQFFITYAPAHDLDGKYTIFGQVVAGMEVVNKLAPRNPGQNADLPPGDKILEIMIDEK